MIPTPNGIDVKNEAKKILGIRTDIAGAYTYYDGKNVDAIIALCHRVAA